MTIPKSILVPIALVLVGCLLGQSLHAQDDVDDDSSSLEWTDVMEASEILQVQYSEEFADPFYDDADHHDGVVIWDESEIEQPYHDVDKASACSHQGCDAVGCDSIGCDSMGCRAACQKSKYWAKAEYLNWRLSGVRIPALITTSPVGTSSTDAGVLGLATTTVLLGNQEIGDSNRSGGRIEFGSWIDRRQQIGWHAAYFGLETADDRFAFDSGSTPILARPFFSVEPGADGPNADLIGLPGEVSGSSTVELSTTLTGAELMLRRTLVRSRNRRFSVIAGYQYASLEDDLRISDSKRVIGGGTGLAIGTTLNDFDRFETNNQFNGAAIGFLNSTRYCRWNLDLGMQLALGNNRSQVFIDGSTTSTVPIPGGGVDVATTSGGLLALPSNSGTFERDEFAIAPQLHAGLSYEFNQQLRGLIGYRFLYISNVARSGDQIDPSINLSQLDPAGLNGTSRPEFEFQFTDFLAHGLNVGIDYRF